MAVKAIGKVVALAILAGALAFVSGISDIQGPARAQQVLPSEPLSIAGQRGEYEFTVEVADEPREQSVGLMFREEMAADHGMLFDFGETRMVQMWMKNTPLSLDMLFIRSDGTIATIAERTEPFSLDTISSGEPVSHVLELRGGVAKMLGLKPGDRVKHDSFTE